MLIYLDVDSGIEIKISGANSVRNHISEGLRSPFRPLLSNFCRSKFEEIYSNLIQHHTQNYNIAIWQQGREWLRRRAFRGRNRISFPHIFLSKHLFVFIFGLFQSSYSFSSTRDQMTDSKSKLLHLTAAKWCKKLLHKPYKTKYNISVLLTKLGGSKIVILAFNKG